jgi:hypothetical protein
MSREFQPGDKVSLPRHIRTVKTVEQHNSVGLRLLYFDDGGCGLVDNFEIVEPSVTHRKLREVLTELRRNNEPDANREQMSAWNAALEAFFLQLTGERT